MYEITYNKHIKTLLEKKILIFIKNVCKIPHMWHNIITYYSSPKSLSKKYYKWFMRNNMF